MFRPRRAATRAVTAVHGQAPHLMDASRTVPTLCVLVMNTAPSRKPASSIQVVPVISPLPFKENQPANTWSDRRSASRKNGGDAGSHRTHADLQRPVARNQRRHADFDARDVGDGVERSRRAVKGDAKVPRPWFGLGCCGMSSAQDDRRSDESGRNRFIRMDADCKAAIPRRRNACRKSGPFGSPLRSGGPQAAPCLIYLRRLFEVLVAAPEIESRPGADLFLAVQELEPDMRVAANAAERRLLGDRDGPLGEMSSNSTSASP